MLCCNIVFVPKNLLVYVAPYCPNLCVCLLDVPCVYVFCVTRLHTPFVCRFVSILFCVCFAPCVCPHVYIPCVWSLGPVGDDIYGRMRCPVGWHVRWDDMPGVVTRAVDDGAAGGGHNSVKTIQNLTRFQNLLCETHSCILAVFE